MMKLTCDMLTCLEGKTVSVAESCTGGMIGAAFTAVPGSSRVFKGGIISYTNEVKNRVLGVSRDLLEREGAVSAPVAEAMAKGVRDVLQTDYGISVTGLAGPGSDEFDNPVGTVYVGYADNDGTVSERYLFEGNREQVRQQAVDAALNMLFRKI